MGLPLLMTIHKPCSFEENRDVFDALWPLNAYEGSEGSNSQTWVENVFQCSTQTLVLSRREIINTVLVSPPSVVQYYKIEI